MLRSLDAYAALNRTTRGSQRVLAQILDVLKLVLLACACVVGSASAAERIAAVRVWPAQDYTRITIESHRPLQHEQAWPQGSCD